ncbi:MAG: hypothetical protein M1838_001431 [Thelocarpon superellum]|nr:MAG: hypothetical protein M1838_001431 [Thelocarpon superellum]
MNAPTSSSTDEAITSLVETYHSLNIPTITELNEPPSPLEFMRFVARNRPFVVRSGCAAWRATRKWDAAYLRKTMGERLVNVAITPRGNADAVLFEDDEREEDKSEEASAAPSPPPPGAAMFVKPLETPERFSDFLDHVQAQELEPSPAPSSPSPPGPNLIYPKEAENNNLPDEYAPLAGDVERDIAWARIALERHEGPDAVNVWIGNSRSVTALHRDNYENVYCQIVGRKRFVLLPPVEVACVNETRLVSATYIWKEVDDDERTKGGEEGEEEKNKKKKTKTELVPCLDHPITTIPFPTWDPDRPEEHPTRFSHLSRPMRVELGPSDMLYLPALWYDMEFSGVFHSASSFIRDVSLPALGEESTGLL